MKGPGRHSPFYLKITLAVIGFLIATTFAAVVFRDPARAFVTSAALGFYDNSDKIWAHRVNSVGKLKTVAGVFTGIEVDLVFVKDVKDPHFDVTHSIKESIGLSLDEFLSESAGLSRGLDFWFDIKNISNDNFSDVLSRLDFLIERHSLGQNFIVFESTGHEQLGKVNDPRLFTSYYLPYLELQEMSETRKRAVGKELAENARRAKVRAVSCADYMYDYVNQYVLPHLDGVMMLTWYPTRQVIDMSFRSRLQEIINNRDVRVVLVSFPSRFDR
jgi:hypothetical protein